MKILIVYHSKTGNTKAMAEAVGAGVRAEGVEAVLKPVQAAEVTELPDYDGIIIGSPTYFAAVSAEIKRFIDDSIKVWKELRGKVGAAFVSAGGVGGGGETAILDILRAFLVHGMIVPGFVEGGHYGPLSIERPDEAKTQACREFGADVARLVKKIAV